MKRLFTTVLLLCLLLATVALAADTARVATKENAIRSDARFFAPVKTTVRYRDMVTVLGKKGDWYKVRFKGTEGYIHKSGLEEKSIGLGSLAGRGSGGATSDEVALAGKGFNPQVEASYKKSHPNLDFGKVDWIEQGPVVDEDLKQFIAEGRLNQP